MSDLRIRIRDEILRDGPIPFARFMNLCLYAEKLGYYETPREIGKAGDFYTSVSVGSFFGQLLARQFAEWLQPLDKNGAGAIQIVEAAAHDGRLSADILEALQSARPEIFDRVEYWIIEPSLVRREIQQDALSRFGAKVRWFDGFESVPSIHGVLFSNELLDAFPVHRVLWDAAKQHWLESCVDWNGTGFVWITAELSFPATDILVPRELTPHLPDQFTFEVGRGAQEWWQRAATKLQSGKLVAIDYGFTVEEFLRSGKTRGTVRAYKQHRLSDNLLADVGEQDLTAHVNFDAIQNAGERAGLKTNALLSQAQFLTGIFEGLAKSPAGFNGAAKTVKQFQTLTSPEHLGRFRVLIQSR
ncbi:MAG: hypothetical protein JWM68_4993 [Verrucomicrobiales bacterium]|nr:hypothetical protein [Verrucomicrobiales bacterium]